MSQLSNTLRAELRKERSQLKNKLSVMHEEIKSTENHLALVDGMLGVSGQVGIGAKLLGLKDKPVQKNGLPFRKRAVIMPRGQGQLWVCSLLGKLKTASYAEAVAVMAEKHMPMMLRKHNFDGKQIRSRVSALLHHSSKTGLVKIERRAGEVNLYSLTMKGRNLVAKNEAYLRKLTS